MLHEITIDQFENLLGQTITLEYDDGALAVELAEVTALHSPSPRPQPSFSLTLRADALAPLVDQGMCRLQHPTLGALDLFVVPTGPDGQGNCYQIIFN